MHILAMYSTQRWALLAVTHRKQKQQAITSDSKTKFNSNRAYSFLSFFLSFLPAAVPAKVQCNTAVRDGGCIHLRRSAGADAGAVARDVAGEER